MPFGIDVCCVKASPARICAGIGFDELQMRVVDHVHVEVVGCDGGASVEGDEVRLCPAILRHGSGSVRSVIPPGELPSLLISIRPL